MKIKQIIGLVLLTVLVLLSTLVGGSVFEKNDAGYMQVKQAAISGRLTCRMEPGMYSQLFGCFVVLVNRVGFEDGLSFWGGSRVLAPGGVRAFEAPLLESGLFHCEIDRAAVRRHRIADPTLRSERLDITLTELQRIQRQRQDAPSPGDEETHQA